MSDLQDYYNIHASPEAMRYWSTQPHDSPDVTQVKLERMAELFRARPTVFMLEHQGRVIGSAGVASENEIGFILHPDHHRKGFASEALRVIIPHVWETTDLPDLMADVDPRNDASIGLLKSFGFTETHRVQNTFEIAGEWVHSVYFRLNRPG